MNPISHNEAFAALVVAVRVLSRRCGVRIVNIPTGSLKPLLDKDAKNWPISMRRIVEDRTMRVADVDYKDIRDSIEICAFGETPVKKESPVEWMKLDESDIAFELKGTEHERGFDFNA